MNRYLILALIVSLAGLVWVTGCTTADQSAMKRSLYVDAHPEFTEIMADAILQQEIMIGMTEEMVEVAWGKPVRVEETREPEMKLRWIYGNYFVGGNITSLYFDEDGALARYEVNNEQTHANNGTLSDGGSQAALSRSDANVMMRKGSGTP